MSATAVIVVDSIMRNSEHGHVLHPGKLLFLGLASTMNVAVISDDLTYEQLTHFLSIEGLKKPPYMLGKDPTDHPLPNRRVDQLRLLQRLGCDIEYVVESDLTIAFHLVENGYRVMHYVQPFFSRRDFRPDHKLEIQPWDELATELERQREMKALDPRLGADQ